ncbi:hypothetical protein AB0B28_06640 [Glycomyces sp. NPDC046736]|uniref:hypothetical protein n=1 Tax=Glycomyces sp. NPDC046736 TaxID=3155615 RepID=UPI0033D30A2F
MHARRRFLTWLGAIAVASCAGVAVLPRGVLADPLGPECSDATDSCEVVAEHPGSPDGSSGSEGSGGDSASEGGGSGGDAGGLSDCTSAVVDTDADTHPSAGARPAGDDYVLVVETCALPSGASVQSAEWLELGADGQLQIRAEVLAQRAIDRLHLPQPVMDTSPESKQLVHLPIWLAVTEASWEVQSATASVPGLTVTATATPVLASWSMGNGDSRKCTGPGTVWTPAAGETDSSPDCGYLYEQVTEADAEVTVTVTWEIRWSGGGESGSVPDMTTTAQTTWPVIESQSLVQR